MTQFLNDELMSVKAEANRPEFKPVAVTIEQLSNDLVEDLPLKENNLHRLYNAPYPVEDEVSVGGMRHWGLGRYRRVLKVSLSPLPSSESFSQSPESALITKCVEFHASEFVKESEVLSKHFGFYVARP